MLTFSESFFAGAVSGTVSCQCWKFSSYDHHLYHHQVFHASVCISGVVLIVNFLIIKLHYKHCALEKGDLYIIVQDHIYKAGLQKLMP